MIWSYISLTVTNHYFLGNGTIEFDEFLVMMAAKVTGEKADVTTWAHKVPIPYIWDKSFSTLVSAPNHRRKYSSSSKSICSAHPAAVLDIFI